MLIICKSEERGQFLVAILSFKIRFDAESFIRRLHAKSTDLVLFSGFCGAGIFQISPFIKGWQHAIDGEVKIIWYNI